MKLYYAPGSCALASHIALGEAGADYEAVRIDFSKNEQTSKAYLEVNPKGRVPALVVQEGILTETPAILAFIAQRFPAKRLAPLDDPFAFAQMQAFNSYLCSTVHVNHAHMGRGKRWADDPAALEAMKAKVPEANRAAFKLIEEDMLKGPWVMGDAFTVADGYLYTVTRWLKAEGLDAGELFPRVAAHSARVEERPAVQKVLAEHFAGS